VAGWQTAKVGADVDEPAPDGSEVRFLTRLGRASMAHFRLPPGAVSQAVAHRSIEEYWYVAAGEGRMWLWAEEGPEAGEDRLVDLVPGVSVALAPRTHFQFRSIGTDALEVVGVAVPGWPGDHEAYQVDGFWPTA
jgi:mannose-6-phosphate isomerase-like protein (cupin superfamily)